MHIEGNCDAESGALVYFLFFDFLFFFILKEIATPKAAH
jgi:hypothetical protein